MLIGPPWPVRDVEMSSTLERGVPAGKMLASRGLAMLHGGSHRPLTSDAWMVAPVSLEIYAALCDEPTTPMVLTP